MTEAEVRMILAQCAALDNRRITDATVILWYGLFRDYEYGEIKWALYHHASTSTEYLMPAHLISLVNEKRTEWRMMNPVDHVSKTDWLEFERMQEVAAEQCRAIRASGKPYAVDVMNTLEVEGGGDTR